MDDDEKTGARQSEIQTIGTADVGAMPADVMKFEGVGGGANEATALQRRPNPGEIAQEIAETSRENQDRMESAKQQDITAGLAASANSPPREIPPVPESPVREFADHMDRARQAVKDWVRKELHLASHGMSHEDRVKENP